MGDHDQDDDVPTRESFVWREGEREAAYAEVERRQRQAKFDETVAWAKARQAAAAEVVTKNYWHPEAAAEPARQWQRTRERKSGMKLDQKAILAATAQVVREQRDEQRKVNDELRAIIAALTDRIAALEQRGSRSLRAVGE